jgi:hypothetical protein
MRAIDRMLVAKYGTCSTKESDIEGVTGPEDMGDKEPSAIFTLSLSEHR